jgi:hypothetical protein
MTDYPLDIKVSSSTISKTGRVGFNEVVIVDSPPPAGVLMVGIDPAKGLYVWLVAQDTINEHAKTHHGTYSKRIASFKISEPPAWLGRPVLIEQGKIPPAIWDEILMKKTRALQAAVARVFGL